MYKYKTSYCIYSISCFIKTFSSNHNQDKWLGWKDWLNKKFCDKFMEMNNASVSRQKEPTTQVQNKNIKELNDLIEAGANPQAIGRDSRFNDKVEILPENQYLMDFLKQSKFDFGLSSYNEHSQLMKAINKTLTAKTIEEMQDGKFAIDYLLDKQVSQNEEFVIVDDTGSVGQNKPVSNNKDNISKKALGEAWIVAVQLMAQEKCSESGDKLLYKKAISDVIEKLYKHNNSILYYTDEGRNNAMLILASSANQVLLGILETLDQDSANQLKLMQNNEGYNALHMAVSCNNSGMVDQLLKNCKPEQKQNLLTATDNNDNNPLHLAVIAKNNEIVDKILTECTREQKEALFTAVNKLGNNPLHLAVLANSEGIVDKILTECTREQKEALFTAVNYWGHNILHLAFKQSNQPLVRQILQKCTPEQKEALFTAVNYWGNNPIMEAIESKRYDNREAWDNQNVDSMAELTQFFVYLKKSINPKSTEISTNKFQSNLQKNRMHDPELVKIDRQQLETVREFIQHNSPEDHVKLLKKAISLRKQSVVRFLLTENENSKLVDFYLSNMDEKSILELTLDIQAIPERLCMLNLLIIDCGVNINIQNRVGETLLHKMVGKIVVRDNCGSYEEQFRSEIIKYLLHLQADPNIRNEEGDTSLHIAVRRAISEGNNFEVELLLQHDANLTIRNNQADTPLDIIIKTIDPGKESHIKIFKLLLDNIDGDADEYSDDVVKDRLNLIIDMYRVKQNVNDILYVFAEYIAKQGRVYSMTKEQCQFLIQSAKSQGPIAQQKALEQVAFILKAFVVLEESVIPDDIKKLMDEVTLPEQLKRKNACNVAQQEKDTQDESKEELEKIYKKKVETIENKLENKLEYKSNGLNDKKSPLPITIPSNSSEEDTLSYVGNFFAQFEQNAQVNEEGDGMISVIDILGELNSARSASDAMVHYTG